MKSAPPQDKLLLTVVIPWLRTRMLLWKISALWALVCFSTWLSAPGLQNSLWDLISTTVLALLLIAAFRLWDDVADIPFDRKHHAKRILVRPPNPTATRTTLYQLVALLLLLADGLLYLLYGWSPVFGLLLISSLMVGVYATLPALTPWRKLRNTLVLLKYPAMLIIMAGGQPDAVTLTIATALYGLLVIYESYTA